jgi:hypothetical protein
VAARPTSSVGRLPGRRPASHHIQRVTGQQPDERALRDPTALARSACRAGHDRRSPAEADPSERGAQAAAVRRRSPSFVEHSMPQPLSTVLGRGSSSRVPCRPGIAVPRYDNARMVAPDGVALCTASRRRCEWYVAKGLAVQVCSARLLGLSGNGACTQTCLLGLSGNGACAQACARTHDAPRSLRSRW